ncbi:Crp/Fnr family transcriptional regulator [Mucilaginibacter celer]|uniref:Crp/Fnr family transcriptional regulator n=1 Tax=Mucilaginibacter celer TaxID=2305508 RepID=A0A494W4U4_9SPHI|nr:Crp/Fnr family transcriptional regulator [Mucilaginibacter celer]AYL98505.1 Crp/Fnr family transcriptional regulator [Mucilaginibacter celer]
MKEAFENYLNQYTQLSDEEMRQILDLATTRKLKRNEALLSAGQICRHKIFVLSGMLRNYAVKEDGSEHILQFSPESSWTLDVESYDSQQPAKYNIAAIEPTEVLLWNKADFDGLIAGLPQFKQHSQQLISRNIYNSRQRILTALSGSPEEKYEDFVKTYPTLLSRLPLRMIAAYLGVSIKTLTRLRHNQLQ